MKKLTSTQQRVYEELIEKVNNARSCKDYDEYWDKYCSSIQRRWKPDYEKYYIEALNGIAGICRAKHETLKKLEMLGLIKIINIEWNKIQLVEN